MGKRWQSTKTGYVQAGFLNRQDTLLEWSNGGLLTPEAFNLFDRNKQDATAAAKSDAVCFPRLPARDFEVRRVRVTVLFEDITDGEEAA